MATAAMVSAQLLGLTDFNLSGPGYILQTTCGNAAEASCGNVHTYTIVDSNCNPANINNNCGANFKWEIRDAGLGNNYFLSNNGLGNWSQHMGAVLTLQNSNLKLTVLDISCYIECYLEVITCFYWSKLLLY